MVKATVQVVSLDSPHTLLEIMEWRQKALGVKSQMMFLPDADVPKDVMERAQETGETLVRPSDPAAGEEARREQVLTDLWTVFLDAAGGKAEKASALSIKAVKRHLGRDVGGLADLTLEEVRTLAGLIRPEGPGQ